MSIREIWSPLGPRWSLGTVDDVAGTAYTHISRPSEDTAVVHLTGGGEVWFTSTSGSKWWPEPGAESLTLTEISSGRWQLSELDGTVSEFARDRPTGQLQAGQRLLAGEQLLSARGATPG